LVLLTIAAGALGPLVDLPAAEGRASWTHFHPVFSLLLAALIAQGFNRELRDSRWAGVVALKGTVRQLSRLVYLVLYVLILLKQIICAAALVRHDGSIELSRLWSDGGAALQATILQCGEDFRGYLFAGVLALFAIRLVAAWLADAASAEQRQGEALKFRVRLP
jgi:hypothetical protein